MIFLKLACHQVGLVAVAIHQHVGGAVDVEVGSHGLCSFPMLFLDDSVVVLWIGGIWIGKKTIIARPRS